MIGADGEDAIVIEENGAVLVYKGGEKAETRFVNSSVQALSQFLYLIAEIKRMDYQGVVWFKQKLSNLREHLMDIDGVALTDDQQHVWRVLLDDMETMAF